MYRRIDISVFVITGLVIVAGVTKGVHINKLRVPSLLKNGTADFVTLDCDYTVDDKEKLGLVVKWTLNKKVVYQWIPNQRPQDLGVLRGKLNLNYKADKDPYKMYRALKIMGPSVELTGDWVCKVSTFEGEAIKAARMVIYSPEEDMDVKVMRSRRPGYVNISCWASGVYPEPRLTLYHGHNRDEIVDDMVVETRFNSRKGAYDVKAYKVMSDEELSNVPSVFDCELIIPNTNYVTRRSTHYKPGSLPLMDRGYMSSSGGVGPIPMDPWKMCAPLLLTVTMLASSGSSSITIPRAIVDLQNSIGVVSSLLGSLCCTLLFSLLCSL